MKPSLSRKAAIREYKMQVPARGAFALRCLSSGRVWVGTSPNLEAARNQIWFMLRNGLHHDPTLQTEWNVAGESSFHFETIATLDRDAAALSVPDLLKDLKHRWAHRLGAAVLR